MCSARANSLMLRSLERVAPGCSIDNVRTASLASSVRPSNIDGAGKFDQDAVAHGLDGAAAAPGDGGVDQLVAQRLQSPQRAFLVGAGQPAIARDIGGEDRGKPALHVLLRHTHSPN